MTDPQVIPHVFSTPLFRAASVIARQIPLSPIGQERLDRVIVDSVDPGMAQAIADWLEEDASADVVVDGEPLGGWVIRWKPLVPGRWEDTGNGAQVWEPRKHLAQA